jgi:Xaa-Pro aminopeptidase
MLTAEGCRARRHRLLDRLKPTGPLLFGDPINLRYLAGFAVEPFSLGADYGGLLLLNPDGSTRLFYDHRLPKSVEAAHTDEKVAVKWYDGQSPGQGPRRLILRPVLDGIGTNGRIHDDLSDPLAPELFNAIGDLRRVKDDDEVAVFRECCRAAESGQAWARTGVRPGMTELDVYNAIFVECSRRAGRPVIVYGDFAVSPGSARRGGPPTGHVIQPGEMLILDYSVVIQGYRCDFTNTLVVGAVPTPEQRRLFDLCVAAMAAGERSLRPGVTGREVYEAVRGVFLGAGVADHFPHHAGHGIGLGHPEAPFLVKHSGEQLLAGDVVTLEPGLYVDGVGGIRIEHNYLVTEAGFERLSRHEITLT